MRLPVSRADTARIKSMVKNPLWSAMHFQERIRPRCEALGPHDEVPKSDPPAALSGDSALRNDPAVYPQV